MGYGDNHGVSYFHCTSLSHTRESRIDPTFHIRSCFPVEINCIVNFPLLMWLFEYSCTSVVCRTREYIITYMLSLLMLVSDTFTGTVVPNIVVCRTRLSDTSTKWMMLSIFEQRTYSWLNKLVVNIMSTRRNSENSREPSSTAPHWARSIGPSWSPSREELSKTGTITVLPYCYYAMHLVSGHSSRSRAFQISTPEHTSVAVP